MVNFGIDPFYLISTLVGLIIWFTRLESKTNRNEKDISKIEKKHDNLESKLIDELSDVKQSLARIEGSLGK